MNKWIIVVNMLAVSLLVSACQSTTTPTPNIQETVQAQVAVVTTQTAIAQTQATVAAEKTAIVATQTAMAAVPPSTPVLPTLTPAAPAVTTVVPNFTPTSRPTSIPTQVPTAIPQSSGSLCPFYVYTDWGSDKNHYVPEGWMGDIGDIQFDDNYQLDPSRPDVIQLTYKPSGSNQWAGLYWWDPPGSNWADKDGGFNLSCASKLTFWARGDKGGEKAEFKVGGLKGTYQDSLQPALSTGPIVLTNGWKQYTLDLTGKDLSHMIGGLVWLTNKPSNPDGATIYVDEIRFE